jgi:hypothetical protein
MKANINNNSDNVNNVSERNNSIFKILVPMEALTSWTFKDLKNN